MRKHRFSFAVISAILSFLAVPLTSHAGGLIHNLPPDGTWVLYRAKTELDLQGNLQSFDRELKMCSVGKEEVNGEPARWIELSTEIAGARVIAKLLILEKYLKADQNPYEHLVRAWIRGRDGEVRELTESRLRQILIFAVTVPHFDKPEKREKQHVKTGLGEYECEHVTGVHEMEGFQNNKVKLEGDLWTHEKVPFGLVRAKVKGDIGVGVIETELEVIKSGTDAKTELPDAK